MSAAYYEIPVVFVVRGEDEEDAARNLIPALPTDRWDDRCDALDSWYMPNHAADGTTEADHEVKRWAGPLLRELAYDLAQAVAVATCREDARVAAELAERILAIRDVEAVAS